VDEQPRTPSETSTERAETRDAESSGRGGDPAERMCAALASADARWTRRAAARSTGDA